MFDFLVGLFVRVFGHEELSTLIYHNVPKKSTKGEGVNGGNSEILFIIHQLANYD